MSVRACPRYDEGHRRSFIVDARSHSYESENRRKRLTLGVLNTPTDLVRTSEPASLNVPLSDTFVTITTLIHKGAYEVESMKW